MKYEIIDCIDAGTEYCPCHLAETGDCILCSELCNKTFCDCINWKGTCIYQEFIWNNKKAKGERKNYICKILEKTKVEENLFSLKINVPYELAQSLVHPGSFVFLKNPSYEEYFKSPISIMDVDTTNETILVTLENKGVKTKKIDDLEENDNILVKGPFWNGILGLRHIRNCKEGNALIIARGIGMAPVVPVIKKLSSNKNKITLIIDKANLKSNFIKYYLNLYNVEFIECNTLDEGQLTKEVKEIISNIINKKNINLIHCSGADILIYKILEFIGDNTNYSCSNNAKMCCGEGVCGGCILKFDGDVVKRMCKLQIDPKYIFKGRRLL